MSPGAEFRLAPAAIRAVIAGERNGPIRLRAEHRSRDCAPHPRFSE